MQDKIFEVVVPTEEEIVLKEGKRTAERKKIFPGYILVHMSLDDESWYAVRNTPGVTASSLPRTNGRNGRNLFLSRMLK